MKSILCSLVFCVTVASKKEDDGPVEKVVGLLEDLKERIGKDGKSEQAAYDEYACWCEKTTFKSAAAITEIKDTLTMTGNTILRLTGNIATLNSEIAGLEADIKENLAQQEAATNIRNKENAAFTAEAAELQQAITALEKAITVLTSATTGKSSDDASFVQTSKWDSTVTELVSKVSKASVSAKLNEKQISLLGELSKKHSSSYAPQSATIQGILSDMYTTMTKDLQTRTSEEAKSYRDYEDLMHTYQKQLKTLQEELVKKQNKKTEAEIQLADANQLYADSEEQLAAEEKLFDSTKAACSEKTKAWQKRSSLRESELEGIEKALEILTSDEAKEIFAKSIKPGFSGGAKEASFVQISSHIVSSSATEKAIEALQSRAMKSHSIRLAALAATVRSQDPGHFDKVIEMIDKLLEQLQEEEQADIKKVNSCKDDLHDTTSNQNDLKWKIKNNKAKIQKHEEAIEKKEEQLKETIASIEEATELLAKMLKERTEENGKYLAAKEDDQKAIELLQKAKKALAEYFESEEYKKSLLQQPGAPDMRISGKDSAKLQTKDVVEFLDMIVTDLNQELAEAKAAEEAAQLDYEKMRDDVEDKKAKLEKKKINLEGQIADEKEAKQAEEDTKKENEDSLSNEEKTEETLRETCDDAIKLQPERREKRAIEAEGLRQAKDFLGGMTSDALLQTKGHGFKESTLPKFLALK